MGDRGSETGSDPLIITKLPNQQTIIKRYKRARYSMDIMRQSACLVVNPITVDSYGFLSNCKTVGQASDLMTVLM